MTGPRPSAARGPVGAALVALGILLSRVFGLVRTRVVASAFGVESVAADAFAAALRIPNFLQNLFGEGVLSASFIPVYSGLLGENDEEGADRLAGAVFAILALLTAVLVLLGIVAAPFLVDVIAGGGFTGERRDLTIQLVRIIFPGTGLLVLSAWCLGILNSHRRFFLSYAAPVVWNAAIIAAILLGRGRTGSMEQLAVWAAWGVVAGSVLQLLVQLPAVLALVRHFSMRVSRGSAALRTVVRNFLPAVLGRGVAQVSAYVDVMIAGNLPLGAVAALTYAQPIYLLPVSLFGMSISAAELPEMSREMRAGPDDGTPDEESAAALRQRLASGLRNVAFLVVPSAVALLLLGDVIAGAIYQTGRFDRDSSVYLWGILAGASVGLLATTMARLHVSAFYALRDARTPLRMALLRITVSVALGLTFAFAGPRLLGIDERWGVAGLTLASGIGGWVELAALRHALSQRLGKVEFRVAYVATLWLCAVLAGAAAWGVKIAAGVESLAPVPLAVLLLGTFSLVYGVTTLVAGVPESRALVRRVTRRVAGGNR